MTTETRQLRIKLAAVDLCDILDRLQDEHHALCELLVEKERALVEVDSDALEQCREEEEMLLRRVIDEEKDRLLVTEEIGDLIDHEDPGGIRVPEILPHLPEGVAKRLASLRESLREVALQMARQNAVNRALIEHTLGHVQVFMSRLAGETLSPGYDASGHKPAAPATGGKPSFLMDRRV